MNVQNIKRLNAELSISVEVRPEVRGEIDSVKLERLLKVLKEISLTFARPNNIPKDDIPIVHQHLASRKILETMMFKPAENTFSFPQFGMIIT